MSDPDFYMSGPEEGDTIDQNVFVCDENGDEVIHVVAGSLAERKQRAEMIAHLLNVSQAEILT